MRIKVLRNIGTTDHKRLGLPLYKENQVVDAEDDEAELLIKQHLAEPTEDPVTEPMQAKAAVPTGELPIRPPMGRELLKGVSDSPKISRTTESK